ncbi:MAG TPA: SufD family Fe-S cluster assembly protein [Patescibacteria group bacterium]|nr:SufD family Fe-S cluster assembly protein [Patescibacteria group bacterium]
MKTIINKIIRGKTKEEYRVQKNETLTLVYLVNSNDYIEIKSSVHLVGDGAKATIIGIVTGGARSIIQINTLQHHAASNTTSNLLIKSVLSDASSLKYFGSIVVDKQAQRTDAYQRNENLLLGTRSTATSSPVLEILANDVRCTHGAVVKTVDENELWYITSRGIDSARGRAMIADGFLKSALNDICLTPKQYKKIFPS